MPNPASQLIATPEESLSTSFDQVVGILGGLVAQGPQLPLEPTDFSGTGNCEGAGVTVHCMRSTAQRSLSTPTTFLSERVVVAAGADIFAPLVHAATGAIAGAGPGGVPITFNNANIQPERARVDNLVLIGMRAKVGVYIIANDSATSFDVGKFVSSFAELIREYIALRIYNTSDASDPWVDTTPLAYFDRPGGGFVAVPPLLFRDRDPRMEIATRSADKGAGAAAFLPLVATDAADVSAQLSILVEALFIPSPGTCGNTWPGSLCPPNRVKNAKGYIGL